MRIYFDLVLLLYMNSVCGFTTNQIMERLNYIEDRINTESKFRRDDFSVLFHEIGSVKAVLQQSREKRKKGKDNAHVQTVGNTDSEVVEKVQMLTTGFKEEKQINTRFRREIPELQLHVQNLKTQTDQIAANLKDILNGIEFLKDQNRKREETFYLFTNEIPEIKQNILDLRAQFEQTEVDESESFDEIKNDTEKIKESIQQLKHSHELCLEKIDMKINFTKSLEEKLREEVLGSSGTDSLTTEYNESKGTVSSLPVPSIPSTTPDILMTKYSSCLELYQNGFKSNAVYGIEIDQERDISVYCDMTTDGGGWTVFQRRKDGSVDFYRDWDDYKTGFGDLTGEFWLGNEYLNAMTENDNPHELRIDLQDHEGNRAFAKYSNFKLRSGEQNYKLEVSGYTGNAGDSLSHSDTGNGPHNEMEFSTKDRDRRGCATEYQGAWWFNGCFDSHLNGHYSYTSKCEVGNKSSFSLQWLTPSTWYFVQVGIWTGNEYENLTEVVTAQTKETDHCLYNGRRVPIGEQLVVDCEESCYCANTGRFQCVPVCSKQHSNARACSETAARENCCDLVHHCSYDTCSYLGEPVQHEYSWVIDCAENCTCYDGSVTCVPLCADVMVPENCSNPVLTKSSDGCCEMYKCHDTEDVCQYMNMSHRVGTWFQSTDCEICTCMPSREVTCVNLSKCLPTALPEQSVTCPEPSLLDNQCCRKILCEKQTDNNDILSTFTITKYPVSSSILVRFQFISTKEEHSAIDMTLFYTTDAKNNNFTVWASNVTVKFSDVIDTSNDTLEFRDFGKPYVLYKVNRNYLMVIPKLVVNTFYYIKLKIVFDKNQKPIPEYIAETTAIQLPGLHIGAPNHLTSRLNRVYFSAINASSDSAFLSWSISEHLLYNISSFLIKYRPFSRAEWQYTERLIFSDRHFMLKCLYHSSWYEAQLLAHPGEHRLATTFFNTSSIKEISNSQFSLSIRNISIRSSSVIITWNRLPVNTAADVKNIEILWIRENDEDTLLKACVTANSDSYTLQDLGSGCMYTVWMGVSRKDGTIAFTNRMHFVSLHPYNPSHSGSQHSMVVAVTVACVSLVAMVMAIATVVYLLKCKHRASYLEHTSFENRIFQIYDNKEDREL